MSVQRALLLLAVLAACLGLAQPPVAEARGMRTYLAKVALVLEGARRTLSWTEVYLHDEHLGQFAHPLSEQYVEMAGHMTPPDRLRLVHPHLLLIAENVERAVAAASMGDQPAFRQRRRVVREEIHTLESILKHLKVRLPELQR